VIIHPAHRRWDLATQHRAFLGGLGLLDRAPALTSDVLLALHEMLLPPTNPHRGRFRTGPTKVWWNGVGREKPDPATALALTQQTLQRINLEIRAGLSGAVAKSSAARAHLDITDAHPFGDGNGRVARSVAAWILWRGGYALLMDPGLHCHQRNGEYYRAVASHCVDPRPWERFFDQLVERCFREVAA
jgi:Fic family protein